MNQFGGLVELILVFGLVLGWGLYELRSVSRDRKKAEEQAKAEKDKV